VPIDPELDEASFVTTPLHTKLRYMRRYVRVARRVRAGRACHMPHASDEFF
jgi:hypothetical protein